MNLWLNVKIRLSIICCCCLTGCGTSIDVGKVNGQVNLNGKPARVAGLWITFFCSDGQVFAAPVDDNGRFNSPKMPNGTVRVGFNIVGLTEPMPSLTGSVPIPPGITDPQEVVKLMQSQAQQKSSPNDQKKLPILKKYLDPLTSGLTTTIQAGQATEFNPEILAP